MSESALGLDWLALMSLGASCACESEDAVVWDVSGGLYTKLLV